MELNMLSAISPIDGRYRNKVSALAKYFSEFGLIKYRIRVEVLYFIELCETVPQLASVSKQQKNALREWADQFDEEAAQGVKKTEGITNHDVKAVEYAIKDYFNNNELEEYVEFVHFGLTSQDVNNTAIPLSIKDYLEEEYYPCIDDFLEELERKCKMWSQISMLARTHGQPASPTRLGKEFEVFLVRLRTQLESLKKIPLAAKFGGATGNFNAHKIAYPEQDWLAFGKNFVELSLGLQHSFPTTQIEHYDHLAALFDNLKRINTILMDFSRDVWQYISMDYFKQKIVAGEIGSSAMPHKVNPIDFENAEGNLGIANALLEHLAAKLPISRLQRDLTDSTVLRNVGVPFAHISISFSSLLKGLSKLELNEAKLKADLDDNWAVVAEAIQTILRREGYPQPYEALKGLTRKNEKIDEATIKDFIKKLNLSDEVKEELLLISPHNYTGI
ncbi:MAG: adenylosuccinate lyase [Cyclobacteriaceae bacterium]|nr:adenylosuccinate lyase [Cyclobacteriaceae bacterium]MCH8516824.1 adenylosuccinate lyase [Cyclobacteriaceae bacterium]